MISLIIVIKVTSILDLEFGMAPWRPLAPLIDREKKSYKFILSYQNCIRTYRRDGRETPGPTYVRTDLFNTGICFGYRYISVSDQDDNVGI